MPFDINVAFNVQTQELVNARNALQSLTQASRELNTNQDKAVKTAEKLVDVNEKLAESASSASKAAEKSEKATKSLAGEGDAAATKLARLKDQLSFLRDDLNLSEVGFTKSQAGVLAWAKSVGATNDIIKQFANTFDNLNKVTGSNPFDQSAKGLSSLTREFYELIAVQDLAASGFGLTAKQVQMLSRDIESLQQQNRAFGRDANDGVDKLRAEFLDAANSVNSYRDQIKAAQQANESLFKQEQELARHRNSANNELMKTWADGVGKRSQAMEQLSAQYAQEAKAAASAEKVAADAIAYTDRETRRLIETNDLLSRGFTSSSANAIFKYKEALEKTGISAIDLKQKLYLLEQDLAKRQGTSPFAKMREDIKQVTQQTNHLARAISVQLGDVAISLAGGQNPFVVLLQQGDQIRGAVQQAVDAGQSINKAMAGAFASMFNSFKLVGTVVKEFAMDGLRSVGDSLNVVANQMARNNSINKQFADGTIIATRHARLLEQASLQNAKALGTLRLVALGTAAAFAVTLVAAYVSLSKEQDAVAKSNAQFGASFGASTQEALAMARGLREFGVNTETAIAAMTGLMKAGNIGKESFEGITLAAANAQKWVGVSIDETIKKFSDLGKDPLKVLSEFTQQTGYLSQAQLQLVRDLEEAGNGTEAQRVAIDLLKQGYNSMTADAQRDMSALGVAMTELTSTTSTLWDEFKNSKLVEASLKVVKAVIDVVAVSAHALVTVVRDLAITAGFAIDLVSGGPGSVSDKWDTYTKALAENAENHNKWSETLINGTQAQEGLTAAQRAANASAEQVSLGLDKMAKANEENVKSLAKSVDMQTYATKRLEEENKAITKSFTEAQKKAFFESEQYRVQSLASEKRFQKEWIDANKKREEVASETYKAVRDNTIVETKKFYDNQLKALQDYESKQSQVNKSAYDSRAISLGEYLAEELQLVSSSQKQQLDILKTSEAAYLSNVEARKKVLTAAAQEAIAKGGNATKIMEKLAQDIENLENSTRSSTEAFKTQREALENATNAKYAKFYEEIAKTINSSKDALEKFNETISDNARKRSESLEEQRTLLTLHGAEAAAYKASRSAMSGYSSQIRETKKALKEANEALEDFNKTTAFDDASSFEQYKILVENKTQAELRFIETTSEAQKDANNAAADAMLEYNLGVFKEIRDSLSEGIYNAIFEGGSNGGKALKDSLKKMFKNYVINVVLNPIMNQVTGLLGIGGGSAGAGGILGTASNLSSLYNAFSGGLVSSIGGAIGSLGSFFGSSALTSFASGMAGITGAGAITGAAAGTGLGLSASAGGLGLSAGGLGLSAGAGTASSVGAGAAGAASAGSAFAAAVPWLAGAFALYSIAKSFDNSGTPHYGAGAIYKDGVVTGGADIYNRQTFGQGARGEWTASAQTNVSGIATALGTALDSVATSFGNKAGYSIYTAFADDSSKDGAWGSLKIADALGNTLVNWEDTRTSRWAPKVFGNGEQGYNQYLDAIAKDVKSAFLAMDLPSWADNLLNAAKDLDTLNAALVKIGAIKAGFDALANTMSTFKDISQEMQTALLGAAGGFENLASIASGYYQAVYSEEERMQAAAKNINKVLSDLNIFNDRGGLDVTSEGATQKLRQAVEELMAAGNAELATQLMAMAGSFVEIANYASQAAQTAAEEAKRATEEAKKAAEEARQNAINLAFANLEAAINREKEYWSRVAKSSEETIRSISSIVETLSSNVRELYNTVDGTQKMLASEAAEYIEGALAGVRGGASLGNYTELKDAISAARGGLSASNYATKAELDRDSLILAAQLAELEKVGGTQLTTEQKTLEAANTQIEKLDKTLEYWRKLINGTEAGIDATLSVAAAIAKLSALLGGAAGGSSGGTTSGGASFGGGSGPAISGNSPSLDSFKYLRDTWLYDNYYAQRGTNDSRLDPLAELIRSFSGSGDVKGLLEAARDAGFSLSDVQAASTGTDSVYRNSTYKQWLEAAQSVGIPAFRVGANNIPRDTLAVLHEGEAVLPEEYNPWAGGKAPAAFSDIKTPEIASPNSRVGSVAENTAEVAAEVRTMRQEFIHEISMLRAEARATAVNTSKSARILDDVTQGGERFRVTTV